MTREEIYDSEIAPKLLEVGRICQQHEMSFVAQVEYDASIAGCGLTECRRPVVPKREISATQLLVHQAACCKGNVDILIAWIMQHATKHGHNSIYLQQLGVKSEVPYSEPVSVAVADIQSPPSPQPGRLPASDFLASSN